MQSLNFQVNNQHHSTTCHPGSSLLSLLRQLNYFGVHRVCETGDCGACTVWVNDTPVHSCIYPAMRINNKDVTTVEGLSSNNQLAPIQQAFLQAQGFQCGFCTPGTIMSAAKFPKGSQEDLRTCMKGNLCRCTGYQAIIESILLFQNSNGRGIVATPPILTPHSVGESVPKQDGTAIVTGKAYYTADNLQSGLLHLKILRSPIPHAKIRKIDVDKAKALRGVVDIFTYKDVRRVPYTTAGHAEPVPDPLDHYLLDNKVRFVGDRVAAVVAESVAIAERACELIEVNYEVLPHVTNPVEAMRDGSVIIHDEPESLQIPDRNRNIAGEIFLESGNVETGFDQADLIIENTYTLPAVQHVHLEPHVTVTHLESDGTLVVRSSTQVPFHCQRLLSQLFDIPKEKIRVYKPQLGGGFGNKQEILTEDLCALATLKTGKPVQWEMSRNEEFTATNSRHAMTIKLKTGVKADGTIIAQDLKIIANTGAYGNHGKTVVFLSGYIPLGLYRCENKRFSAYAVYTNTMPGGAFRGYGATQGTFAMESQIDEIANKLGIDVIEIRNKNLIRPGDLVSLGNDGEHFNLIGSYAVEECFTKVIQALNYVPDKPAVINGNRRRGVGFAVSMQGSGLCKIHTACVKLSRLANGKYELRTGSVDVGTGSDTTLRQIAAEVLGVTVTDIKIISGDTQLTPFDAGSYASATMYISGQAVKLGADKLKQKLHGNTTSQEIIEVEESYTADEATLTFAVQGVEVEVDIETGKVEVLRCVQAIDIGKAINPKICEGQATGGIAMGIGYALTEELLFDKQGRIINPKLREYRIPTAADMPPMEVFLIEKTDPYGPFGAKGVGEITANCTAPAIANAIAHATSARLRQLPMTPERVWKKLEIRS
ncbi:aerobic-type carbon monoxide dehydrogenase, large subunit CoxL/CutL-like protein [Rivularia sp. PCC 7116]|uniref:molybdopterin-dependent oxidoreductase n=1 Tax=Rivularia sp. PCC 7116 TaxID=373994 RepID=UPI00029EE73A|nr:molybdopterin cofactor-binding domain-containing protein [Rivularia sp. PCC 7116]AFY54708.1 aerobic-type carbon monoxide dehydrogenase, large subunit CoxL/CutL-like protein [Rivularia sp. PCC 7116]